MAIEKRYIFDLWGDTRDNLDSLSEASKVSTAELVRRGAESAVILYGIEPAQLAESLIETLDKLRNGALHGSKQELISDLSKAVAFAASLSAIHTINHGRESRGALQIYGESFRQHLSLLQIRDIGFKQKERETLKADVDSFLNLLTKMEKIGSSRMRNLDH